MSASNDVRFPGDLFLSLVRNRLDGCTGQRGTAADYKNKIKTIKYFVRHIIEQK